MFKRFLRNTDGNVLLTSALSIPVLLVGAGISIDMAELYRAKTSYQAAVDAAALAAAKILSKSGNGPHAESYGAKGYLIESAEQFPDLLQQCLDSKGVHLIDLPIDYSENQEVFKI